MTETFEITNSLIVDIAGLSILALGTLAAFIYSLVHFFTPAGALYKKMVGCAFACLFVGRVYEIVQYIVAGDLPDIFQIASFGNIGCFLFLFSANYGAINSLTDDGSTEVRKYRRLALTGMLVFAAAIIAICLSPSHPSRIIACVVEEVCMGMSAYFSLKLLIIPKQYADFMATLRPFHLLALLLALVLTVENILWCYLNYDPVAWTFFYIVQLVIILALAPVLQWGTKKWKI